MRGRRHPQRQCFQMHPSPLSFSLGAQSQAWCSWPARQAHWAQAAGQSGTEQGRAEQQNAATAAVKSRVEGKTTEDTDKPDTEHRPVRAMGTPKHLQSEVYPGLGRERPWRGISTRTGQKGADDSCRSGEDVAEDVGVRGAFCVWDTGRQRRDEEKGAPLQWLQT